MPPLLNFGARLERKLAPLSRRTMISFALLTLGWGIRSFAAPPKHAQPGLSVLVTGASGRTGKILYAYMKADPRIGEVRALVYGSGTGSAAERQKAAVALNCSACDASEGIFYGDVTAPSSLTAAFDGMDTVATYVESKVAQRFRPAGSPQIPDRTFRLSQASARTGRLYRPQSRPMSRPRWLRLRPAGSPKASLSARVCLRLS